MSKPIAPGESREHYKRRLADNLCQEIPEELPCPCCYGAGEHAYGDGPDADTYACKSCKGEGWLKVVVL